MSPEVRQRRPRIAALDVIRGFALCGILLANVQPIAGAGAAPVPETQGSAGYVWLGLLVQQRFFPIFSLLFGIGFSLLLRAAGERTARPRLLLVRRLVALLAMGLAHHLLLWQGDILAVYAVVGLVVLLPSTWLPRWAVAGLLIAGVYVCGMLVLLRTPLRAVLEIVFAPLGRMALTNYLTATVLVLAAAGLVGGAPHEWPAATVLIVAGVILFIQWVWSTLWLGRHLQGPIEWLWRWVTWGRRPAPSVVSTPRDGARPADGVPTRPG
jgi:uncharacterized protein